MEQVLSLLPAEPVGLLAFLCVSLAMAALGAGMDPLKLGLAPGDGRRIALACAVALVIVPAAAIALSVALGLTGPALAGLILVGISPGAPLALRRSRDSGSHAGFATTLQVFIAVLAVAAVPLWLLVIDRLFGSEAQISVTLLAGQVLKVQLLPLAFGAAIGVAVPAVRRLAPFALKLSAVLLVAVILAVLWKIWQPLLDIPPRALLASACVTVMALALGDRACGPFMRTRMAGAILCALRNPGIALLVASANGLPPGTRIMVLAHVLLTAVLVFVYLGLVRRGVQRELAGEGAA